MLDVLVLCYIIVFDKIGILTIGKFKFKVIELIYGYRVDDKFRVIVCCVFDCEKEVFVVVVVMEKGIIYFIGRYCLIKIYIFV